MGDNIPLYFEATFEQQFLLHRLVMQDSHHRQEPIISSWGLQASFVYTNILMFPQRFLIDQRKTFSTTYILSLVLFLQAFTQYIFPFQTSFIKQQNQFISQYQLFSNFIKFHNLIVVYIEPAKLSITVSLFLHCSDFVQKSQFEEGSLKFTICLCWASEAFNHVSDIFTSDHSFPTLAVDNNFAAFCPFFTSFQHSLLHFARLLHLFYVNISEQICNVFIFYLILDMCMHTFNWFSSAEMFWSQLYCVFSLLIFVPIFPSRHSFLSLACRQQFCNNGFANTTIKNNGFENTTKKTMDLQTQQK